MRAGASVTRTVPLANHLPSADETLCAILGPNSTSVINRSPGVVGNVTHVILSEVSETLLISPLDLLHAVSLGDSH